MKIELNKVYFDAKGEQWKVVAILPIHLYFNYIVINKSQNKCNHITESGKVNMVELHDNDLIKLVGDNFTEEKIGD